jgi:hypothetical protein
LRGSILLETICAGLWFAALKGTIVDVTQIASAVAALLAPYLAKAGEELAEKAGGKAWEKAEALYQTIYRKFARDKDKNAQATLERLAKHPESEGNQMALADILIDKAQADLSFGTELSRQVQDVLQGQDAAQFLTQVYDHAQVQKIINIAQAGTVNIN